MRADETRARPGRTVETGIVALEGARRASKDDRVVTEEPLELRLVAGATTKTLAITMRTPGNDFELAAGFVFGEGIVHARDEIGQITYCLDADLEPGSALQRRQRRTDSQRSAGFATLRTPLYDE